MVYTIFIRINAYLRLKIRVLGIVCCELTKVILQLKTGTKYINAFWYKKTFNVNLNKNLIMKINLNLLLNKNKLTAWLQI